MIDWKQNDRVSTRESGRVSFNMRGQACREIARERDRGERQSLLSQERPDSEGIGTDIISKGRIVYTSSYIMHTII